MIACVCMQAAHVHMPIHVTSSLLQQGFGKYLLQTGASWMNFDMGRVTDAITRTITFTISQVFYSLHNYF